MAKIKLSANLPGLHSLPRSVGKGGIPLNAKSAYLELFAYENERARLAREKEQIQVRKREINKKLGTINRTMSQLIKSAAKGGKLKLRNPGDSKEDKRLVLEY